MRAETDYPRFRCEVDVRPATSWRWLVLGAGLWAIVGAGFGFAQEGSVGLSSVRSHQFDNEDLLFFDPQAGDLFAFALAAGDFNNDGADDLASGIPLDDGVAGLGIVDCGAAVVRWGVVGAGLGSDWTFLTQASAGSPDLNEDDDRYGQALATGDFDGDGRADLAVGVPRDDSELSFSQGAVAIHYGLAGGIQLDAHHFIVPGLDGVPLSFYFGWTLAAGDFNGDGKGDLAVGSPLTGSVDIEEFGKVQVLNGSADGLLPYDGYLFDQSNPVILSEAEAFDHFGSALVAGDFNGDSWDDLAIGVPGEDETGAVQILFGSEFGLLFETNVIYRQGEAGGGGVTESGDDFGAALAAGDFDGDGFDDLAVGAPLEDEGSLPLGSPDTGAITVLYGSGSGFDIPRSDYLQQSDIYGVASGDRPFELFGFALASGDFNGDGLEDLAVGHHGEDGDGDARGAVTVLSGAPGGFVGAYRRLSAGVAGIAGATQDSQAFARALAAGDFDGDGHSDLASGIPFFNAPGLPDVGAEIVLYGSLFADGFDGGTSSYWSISVP